MNGWLMRPQSARDQSVNTVSDSHNKNGCRFMTEISLL